MERRLLAVVVACLAVAVANFIIAFPETLVIDGGCCAHGGLARDFSAYYAAAFNLVHDPWRVYLKSNASQALGPIPAAEQFKYLPSFLLLVLPLTFLPYQTALTVFDLAQLALLPLAAFLAYRLIEGKNLGLLKNSAVFVILLVQPSPLPGWGVSVSYFWQWAESQSKVLLMFLLLLSFYLGKSGRVRLSAMTFALAFFDPRVGLLGLPVYLMYNQRSLRESVSWMAAGLGILNSPLLLPGVALGFTSMTFTTGLSTTPYPYLAIPIAAIGVFWVLNYSHVIETGRVLVKPLRETLFSPIRHHS